MIRWIFIFLLLALVSALLGFTGIAGAATTIAQLIFYLFVLSLIVSLVMYFTSRR